MMHRNIPDDSTAMWTDAATSSVVVGVDAGATGTRCLVVSEEGLVLRSGRAPGANQRSSGDAWAESLVQALRAALSGIDPERVAAGFFGVAGAGGAGAATARAAAVSAWRGQRLPGLPVVGMDIVAAFAAGSAAPEGLVLSAGTGAVAARIHTTSVVRRCDGYGWWLGDEGSAVWIGRAALRAVLGAMDGRDPGTALVDTVPRALLGQSAPPPGEDLAQALVARVYGAPPAELGGVAPVVDEAARAGDAVAHRILAEAAERLLHTLDSVRAGQAADGLPVVLSGSVLTRPTLVAELVAQGVRERYGVEPVRAHEGAVGAAALALRHHLGDTARARAAHEKLLDSAG